MPTNSYILIIGGAGFIGSHMVLNLLAIGLKPIVLDNLSKGHRSSVPDEVIFINADVGNKELLRQVFTKYSIAVVMHFASLIEVAESMHSPEKYYENNVVTTLNLLAVMREFGVHHFIFSSSAAVYGEPLYTPIDEAHRLAPLSPYGRSKRMVEEIIQDYAAAYGLRYAILRYFNAAGADPDSRVGEAHHPESHLIPLVLEVAAGLRSQVTIYGRHYQTTDGTCVRDYIHVTDLCQAHLLALQFLQNSTENLICNLGTGSGYSVQQVVDTVRNVTQKQVSTIDGQPRFGDPAILVADAKLAARRLGWQPALSDLPTIVLHAWNFLQKNL